MAKANIHNQTEKESIQLGHPGKRGTQTIEVRLSERNLLSLIAKLYVAGAKREVYKGDIPGGFTLKLVAEEDKDHYKERTEEQDFLDKDTETLMDALRETLSRWEGKHKLVHLFNKGVVERRGEAK